MDYKNLFEKFNEGGKLLLKDATITFDAIPWSKHPASPGVELKHIITSERTDGQFSYHLVRIGIGRIHLWGIRLILGRCGMRVLFR